MRHTIKAIGIVGLVWTAFVLILGLSLPGATPDWRTLSCITMQFFLFWRLYGLRRWAAVAACAYGVWMLLDSFRAGIWQWTLIWILLTLMLMTLVKETWEDLQTGL